MKDPTIPYNEEKRLNALYSYQLLDTPPELVFDRFVEMATNVCETPIGLISLVDKNRCWFKAKIGVDFKEIPREISYPAYAINNPSETMVLPDALADYRFFDCPLVHSELPMRFYAGHPLVNKEGYALGTLGVADYVPRNLTNEQISFLTDLGKEIVEELELRRRF